MIVLLTNGTVGHVDDAKIGQKVVVRLLNEKGVQVEDVGEVEEILEEDDEE